ncbi:hypothetical protein DH2020_043700 [Rehmannia glutinosa]|uniref:Uncharacterized protein n=1 Tax=Rehmannia glutinosa TaxID=99300 RepID=A0ABR0UIY7_REHGL
MIESSKDYVAKALVSTVDHLGSVADKLNKFLDEKTNEFSATNIRFSCIEQIKHVSRICRFERRIATLIEDRSSQAPQAVPFSRQNYVIFNLDNPFVKAFIAAGIKPQPPWLRKGPSRISSSGSSPRPTNFSFTRFMSSNEPGKRSVSPLRFSLKRSGSVANRSVSPSPAHYKPRSPSEPRRAISEHTKPEMRNRESEIEPYTKRSKNLFKALLNVHQSRKENHILQMTQKW